MVYFDDPKNKQIYDDAFKPYSEHEKYINFVKILDHSDCGVDAEPGDILFYRHFDKEPVKYKANSSNSKELT
jgi:hypothetical protein